MPTNKHNSILNRRVASALAIFAVVLPLSGCTGSGETVDSDTGSGPEVTTQDTPAPRNTRTSSNGGGSGAHGKLDSTFGNGGKVLTEFGDNDEARAIVVQPDGKIVVAGEAWAMPEETPSFALARYNANGSLDKSFSKDGKVVTPMSGDDYDYSRVYGLALQPDNKIIAVGSAFLQEPRGHVFAVARFNADGTLDKTFGKGGRVLTPVGNTEEELNDAAMSVVVAEDGKIVVAGGTGMGLSYAAVTSGDVAVVRYDAKGKLDTKFGKGGKVVTGIMQEDAVQAVAIQPDGKIVVGGYGSEDGTYDFIAARYLENGKLDTSFGEGGKVRTNVAGDLDYAYDLALTPEGKIVLAGQAQTDVGACGPADPGRLCEKLGFAVLQYNEDGSVDEGFSDGGLALISAGDTAGGRSIARRDDGKLVVGGHYENDEFAVVLFNEDGSVDESFGDDGVARTNFGLSVDTIEAIALQPDGKIVAAGYGNEDGSLNDNFALARYTVGR